VVFSDAIIIALMMEAASTSETLVNFYQTTRRCNPEDSHLHIRRRENQNLITRLYYKDHFVNAVQGNNSCLLLRIIRLLQVHCGQNAELQIVDTSVVSTGQKRVKQILIESMWRVLKSYRLFPLQIIHGRGMNINIRSDE
jgi:hypothetical protein